MTKTFFAAALALLCLGTVLMSCQNPSAPPSASRSVSVLLGALGRTIVADVASQVTSYAVTLTSQDGYPTLSTTAAAGASANFASVDLGTWDVSVTAYNESTPIGVGSLVDQTVSAGTAASWTVDLSTTQAGTGTFSFSFAVPVEANITSVVGQLYTLQGTLIDGALFTPVLSRSGSDLVGTMSQTRASGAYRLNLTLNRGANVAATFIEAVNIWDGVTSNQWLDGSGTLNAQKTFTVGELKPETKVLTSFFFDSLAVAGTIDQTAHTVAFTPMPYGTAVTALAAGFTTTGASVRVGTTTQVSGTTFNDFTNPVVYTVVAADGSTQNYTVTVSSQAPPAWQTVGTLGFSPDFAYDTDLEINNGGIPFVAYRDAASGNKASVMKFDGGAWVQVGSPGFTPGEVSAPFLAINASGTPFVAYSEYGDNFKASVMKFDGSAWVQVGSASFTPWSAGVFSLALDASGTPFVAYADYNQGGELSVMKFDGSNWVQVGSAAFTPDNVNSGSLAFDGSNTPFVAYGDVNGSKKASVMKFDGSAWVQVGSPGFSADAALYVGLAIDTSGTPFVAYAEADQFKANVKKFDGSAWVQVGAAGFSEDAADYVSLAIDDWGTPYVAYLDYYHESKASVMKFE